MASPRFDPQIDRRRARLAEGVRQSVLADTRRIVIAGVSGWVGRTTAALLHEALGPEAFSRRVVSFGSRSAVHELDEGITVAQHPLEDLARLEPMPTVLFNLAFLTMDKVAQMDEADYVRKNRALSETILSALDAIGVDRLFLASSGAAAYADDESAAANLRLYGGLKRDDEAMFSDWAQAAPAARRAVIARIYSVSGPWINKHEVYALASFILDAQDGKPIEVRSPKRVWRGYVAVRELVSLVFAILLAADGPPVTPFETAGEALELEHVGLRVTEILGGKVTRRPITDQADNRYLGNHVEYVALLAHHGLSHLQLSDQIIETAAYLTRSRASERTSRG